MGRRKVSVKQVAADNIAAIAWFIESKGMVATADKFVEQVYKHIAKLADEIKSYPICREPGRASLGYKCTSYKKKYTIVFLETEKEIIICEFISSKLLHW